MAEGSPSYLSPYCLAIWVVSSHWLSWAGSLWTLVYFHMYTWVVLFANVWKVCTPVIPCALMCGFYVCMCGSIHPHRVLDIHWCPSMCINVILYAYTLASHAHECGSRSTDLVSWVCMYVIILCMLVHVSRHRLISFHMCSSMYVCVATYAHECCRYTFVASCAFLCGSMCIYVQFCVHTWIYMHMCGLRCPHISVCVLFYIGMYFHMYMHVFHVHMCVVLGIDWGVPCLLKYDDYMCTWVWF